LEKRVIIIEEGYKQYISWKIQSTYSRKLKLGLVCEQVIHELGILLKNAAISIN